MTNAKLSTEDSAQVMMLTFLQESQMLLIYELAEIIAGDRRCDCGSEPQMCQLRRLEGIAKGEIEITKAVAILASLAANGVGPA